MKKPIVIAISAVSGGGKTTVINELNRKLPLSIGKKELELDILQDLFLKKKYLK